MNRYIARCIDRLIERDLSIFGEEEKVTQFQMPFL